MLRGLLFPLACSWRVKRSSIFGIVSPGKPNYEPTQHSTRVWDGHPYRSGHPYHLTLSAQYAAESLPLLMFCACRALKLSRRAR